jgi:hypothetical protein
MNEEHSLKKEPQDEVSRQYLIAEIKQLEDKIRELQIQIHESAHKLDSSFQEREYWQKLAARQQ